MTLVPDRIITKPDGTKVRTLDRSYLLDGEKLLSLSELIPMIEMHLSKTQSLTDLIIERLKVKEKQPNDKELISYLIIHGGRYSLAGQDQSCRLLWHTAVHILNVHRVDHVEEM